MNKIYKVVWSKAKHCYVVTSELAKSQTKGCGARSLRMATVSLGVAAALIGGFGSSVAEATYVKVGDTYYAYYSNWDRYYSVEKLYWNPSGKSVTVSATTTDDIGNAMTVDSTSVSGSDSISVKKGYRSIYGNVAYGSAGGTRVIVRRYSDGDGGKITVGGNEKKLYLNPGRAAWYGAHGEVSGYKVTVDIGSSSRVEEVYGGISSDGAVSGNKVNLKSGIVEYGIGGLTENGNVANNSVTLNGSTVYGVTGGRTKVGNATENSITIEKGDVMFYYGSVTGGVTDDGDVLDNTVTIKGGNLVNYAGVDICGGFVYDAGHNATGNKVIISNGTIGSDAGSQYENGFGVVAGYASCGTATDNTVTISGGKFASQSEFEFSGGKSDAVAYVNGDYTDTKTAKANDNKVEISGGTFSKTVDVYGGRGIATAVVISRAGTTTGPATATASANNNKVIISGGTYSGDLYVYGGYGEAGAEAHATGEVATATVTTNGNTVEISGGTFSGDVNVCGGYVHADVSSGSGGTATASTSADNNKVIISGGTINGDIHGGWATDSASGNIVTIKGNATIGENARIHGGWAVRMDNSTSVTLGTAANNTVNIEKAITVAALIGGYGDETDSTGNTLNLSVTDVKSGDISDFQTIALTDALAWENGKTVLSAKNFDFTDSIKATLDISAAANLKNAGSGTMTLLASETNNDFSSLNLKYYNDGSATLNSETSSADVFSQTDYANEKNGVTLTYDTQHTVALDTTNYNKVTYTVTNSAVKTVSFGNSIAWSEGGTVRDVSGEGFTFNGTTAINAANLGFTGKANTALKTDGSSFMTLVKGATGITDTNLTPITAGNGTVDVTYEDAGKIKYAATASGAVSVDATAGDVKYTVDKVTLSSVDIGGWNGTESAVPTGWTADGSVAVNNAAAISVTPTATQTILTATSGMFADVDVTKEVAFDPVTQNGVTLTGTRTNKIKTTQTNVANDTIVYEVGKKDVKTIDIGAVKWQKDATLFDGSDTDYNYANVTALGTDNFAVTYEKPEDVAANDSMTLLKANETLQEMAEQTKNTFYSCAPVSGVTIDASITGKLAASGGKVTFTAAENKASKLTFGDVEWKDSGALMTRPSNITFAGADVDTSKINFTNMIYLDADRQMTLVSDFGDKVGTITGSKYLVGTAFEGEGAASLSGSDLVFRTKTGAGVSEQTHKTVMATEVGVTMLNTGNDYIDKAMEGMGDLANVAPDGTTVGAAIGGGRNRYETGSHVNVNSWNAAVAVGAKRELKNGSLEYGVFGEYGKANYTLHSDAGKGDGDSHYAGGGLLAKWTNKHDVYTEASFRLGRLNESSNDIMRDGLGNKYGYDVHANYFGAHVGVGKIFRYKGGKSLDVYGKYFYTKRDGVEFDAVQHYKLDSVKSSVLRIGARYGTTDKKWNWYGGLAYEYEFDGEATGTVKDTAIRAASIKGSSVRGEIGMRMNATKTNPWQMDISLYGYGGKHRGIGGNVNVAYMF